MYVVRSATERLRFGDIISAGWLYDLYLRHDSIALKFEEDASGRRKYFVNRAPQPERQAGKDTVLAHAGDPEDPQDLVLGSGDPRWAVILTDDCELDSYATDRKSGSGRVLMAPIRRMSPDEIKAAGRPGNYRRFPLEPTAGFAGGVVELQRIFSVSLPSLLEPAPTTERLLGLTENAQERLSKALCAHVTRHGPSVAQVETAKLAALMTADGNATRRGQLLGGDAPATEHQALASQVAAALTAAWEIEQKALNTISDAWEAGDPSAASVTLLKEQIKKARDAFDEAGRLLDVDAEPQPDATPIAASDPHPAGDG